MIKFARYSLSSVCYHEKIQAQFQMIQQLTPFIENLNIKFTKIPPHDISHVFLEIFSHRI
jgi:hypothetical protein